MDKLRTEIEELSRMYNDIERSGHIITSLKYDGKTIHVMKNGLLASAAWLNSLRDIYIINVHPSNVNYKHVLAHELGHIFSGHFIDTNTLTTTANKYNASVLLWAINPMEVEAEAFACEVMGDRIGTTFDGITTRDCSCMLEYVVSKALRISFVWLYMHNKAVVRRFYSLLNNIIK